MAFTRKIDYKRFDSRRVPRKIFFSLKFIPVLIIVLFAVFLIMDNGVFTGLTLNNDIIDQTNQNNQETRESSSPESLFAGPLFYFVSVFIVLVIVMIVILSENRRRKKIVEQVEYLGSMDIGD